VVGLGLLLFPARPLDHEQPAIRVGERLEPAQELGERRDGPHHERVEARRALPALGHERLGRRRVHGQREAGLGDDRRHGPGLLAHAVAELHPQVGPQDRQDHPGRPAAGAHVEHPLAAGQVPRERHGVGDVAAHEAGHVEVSREIQPLVPRPQARRVGGEPVA
jgi:hypothetical protein